MNRKALYILLSIVLTSFFACQNDVPVMEVNDDAKAFITLSAQVEDIADTRLAFEKVNSALPFPFDVAVWASTTRYSYTGSPVADGTSTTVNRHMTATFAQSTTTLNGPNNNGVRYPAANPDPINVYFTGLYPSTSWTTTDGTQAIHSFTGCEDLMYAPEDVGSIDPAVDDPVLTFYHLLTYLRVKIKAESEEALNAWGKLTSIKLVKQNNGADNPKNSLSVALTSPVPASISDVASKTTFSGSPSYLNLYKTGTDDTPFTSLSYTIPTTPTEVAYVLCAPVTASNASNTNEYTLEIETEKRNSTIGNEVLVGIDLKDSSDYFYNANTMGNMFVVTLNFRLHSIAASATIEAWDIAGYGKENVVE